MQYFIAKNMFVLQIVLNIKFLDMRVFRTGLQMPLSLAVADNKIYWIEQRSKQLFWTETDIFSNHKEVESCEFV